MSALPSVMLDLNVPIMELDRAAWIITGYLLGYTVSMPLIGRLGDVYGYPRVYQVSLIVFCIGTALVAVSPSLGWMVGARVIQAVGGAAAVPIGMALATTLVPNEDKGIALGIVGASAEMGSMLGPVYGGVIADVLSWRWIFWLNIPQSLIISPPFFSIFATNASEYELFLSDINSCSLILATYIIGFAVKRNRSLIHLKSFLFNFYSFYGSIK